VLREHLLYEVLSSVTALLYLFPAGQNTLNLLFDSVLPSFQCRLLVRKDLLRLLSYEQPYVNDFFCSLLRFGAHFTNIFNPGLDPGPLLNSSQGDKLKLDSQEKQHRNCDYQQNKKADDPFSRRFPRLCVMALCSRLGTGRVFDLSFLIFLCQFITLDLQLGLFG